MKKTTKRFWTLSIALAITFILTALILKELKANLTFFYTPTEVQASDLRNRLIRVGGFIVEGSIEHEGKFLQFKISDELNTLIVNYNGIAPPLFREKIAVIVQGKLANSILIAKTILIKHDETYKPPSKK